MKIKTKAQKVYLFLFLFILTIVVKYTVMSLMNIFPETLPPRNINLPKNEMLIFSNIIMAFSLIPIIEEILFRALLQINTKTISLFISCVTCYTLAFILKDNALSIKDLIPIITFIAIYLLLTKSNLIHIKNIVLSKNQILGILIFTSIAFSLYHFNKSEFTLSLTFGVGFSLYFINGLIYGYIRIKSGLKWSILLHVFYNLSVILDHADKLL